MPESEALLKVDKLEVSFPNEGNFTTVVKGISYEVWPNEIVGIVGESGSGKSVSSLAILGLLSDNASVEGKISFQQKNILQNNKKAWEQLRGNEISMIFQEPMSSLNPSMKCGKQVVEVLQQHKKITKQEAKDEVIRLFEKVKLPRPSSIFSSYPHQISGGQKQRVMIAMAIACKPMLLIADEPTTALDVSVQKEILNLLKTLQQETQMSVLFISHDLEVVAKLCNRVLVMYQGKIVEQNTAKEIFENPKELYTKALIASRPSVKERVFPLPTVSDFLQNRVSSQPEMASERKKRHDEIYAKSPLLEVKSLVKSFTDQANWWSKKTEFRAVNNVNLRIYEGETLGLVGESGCGKSTLGNLILRLDQPNAGQVFYKGKDITQLKGEALRKLRREIQLIFQDPFSSLNPRIPVGEAIMEPMKVHQLYHSKQERKEKAMALLQRVGLEEFHFNRYPHEFSGGQRQRIGIARTIAVQPKIIVCDESVSALDISVQAQVLNLLNELKDDFGFTYLFISHDLAVVKYMADQLLVMKDGEIVERGEADAVYAQPQHDYTKMLLDAR
ncbi:ABC transporter ATP-binding protein [Psychroflexus planctonicus]|uniref:ABC transporter ATP-binding protein n=1 Tax=Psychroflexus planctonicus TaxID=1526575 RepID=A0ABQ1SBX5_9FLAO|nr:ABC transporter ATP-binding protein [Psychroflexus planctonicus]GGE26390.1 ABC transporter ATP-binding protein [Psychroflexus planctonicus]